MLSELPIIQRFGEFFVGDSGVLDGVGGVGMAELALDCGDVAGFFDEVPAHGVSGVVGGVAPYPGQFAYLIPNRVDHPGVEAAVAVGVGGRR